MDTKRRDVLMQGRRLGIVGATTALALILLAGCTPSSVPDTLSSTAPPVPTPGPTLHPEANAGLWLNDDYANGTGETWAMEYSVCWIEAGGDIAVVNRDYSLVGLRIGTNEVVWKHDVEESCRDVERSHVTDAAPYLVSIAYAQPGAGEESERSYTLVDLRTGDDVMTIAEPADGGIQIIGGNAENAFYQTNVYPEVRKPGVHTVIAVDRGNTVQWSSALPGLSRCSLAVEYVSCETGESDEVINLDVATGAVLSTLQAGDGRDVTMLRDGYLVSSREGSGAEVFNLDGTSYGVRNQVDSRAINYFTALLSKEDIMAESIGFEMLFAGNGTQPFPNGTAPITVAIGSDAHEVYPERLSFDGKTALVRGEVTGWALVDTATMTVTHQLPTDFEGVIKGGYLMAPDGIILPAQD